MGLSTYEKNRQDAFKNVEHPNHFKWELQVHIQNQSDIESLSLKNAIEILAHIVQPDSYADDDVNLLKTTLYEYASMRNVTDHSKRSIGNLTMQALHTINRPDAAFEVKTTSPFFVSPKIKF